MGDTEWHYPLDINGNVINEYEVKINENGNVVMRKCEIPPKIHVEEQGIPEVWIGYDDLTEEHHKLAANDESVMVILKYLNHSKKFFSNYGRISQDKIEEIHVGLLNGRRKLSYYTKEKNTTLFVYRIIAVIFLYEQIKKHRNDGIKFTDLEVNHIKDHHTDRDKTDDRCWKLEVLRVKEHRQKDMRLRRGVPIKTSVGGVCASGIVKPKVSIFKTPGEITNFPVYLPCKFKVNATDEDKDDEELIFFAKNQWERLRFTSSEKYKNAFKGSLKWDFKE